MKLIVTKEWEKLDVKMCTLRIGDDYIRITTSDSKPVGEVGFSYKDVDKSLYSEKDIWVKLPSGSNKESIEVGMELFI